MGCHWRSGTGSPAACADGSVVSEGFSSPPPLLKILQLVLLVGFLAFFFFNWEKKNLRGFCNPELSL